MKEKIWPRACPKCGKTILHTDKNNRNRMEKCGCLCNSCNQRSRSLEQYADLFDRTDFVRSCPKCGRQIVYIHGLNGGEFYVKKVGAFLDGYDKEKNIAFEYDEWWHYDENGNLLPKDIRRMTLVKEVLGCKFIRFNEAKNEIKEYA